MPFPLSPVNGQTTTTNNITYSYNSTLGVWNRVLTAVSAGTATTYTTTATAPSSPRVGDIWYQQSTDIVYRYENDGTSNYWIDFNGPTGGGGGSGSSSTPFTGGSITNSVQIQSSLTVATTILVGTGTTTATQVGLIVGTTDAIALPIGTTAQRPANPQVGMIRYNTSGTLGLEVFVQTSVSTSTSTLSSIYQGTWTSIVSPIYTVNYLVVGGGGGGGNNGNGTATGGGGGAGGLISGTTGVIAGVQYPITVGSGGSVVQTNAGAGSNGGNSVFNSQTAIGGGGGSGAGGAAGGSGGSGGGGSGSGGAGTPGQGNNGGGVGGGGGGAGGVGQTNSAPYVSGAGGIGLTSSISSGTSVYYAGGGGGGVGGSAGGLGGGGASVNGVGSGVAGTAGTGGGGGAGSQASPGYSGPSGAPGGSGVVIISYANASQRASGGAVTSYQSGSTLMWVHTFTTSSVFTA